MDAAEPSTEMAQHHTLDELPKPFRGIHRGVTSATPGEVLRLLLYASNDHPFPEFNFETEMPSLNTEARVLRFYLQKNHPEHFTGYEKDDEEVVDLVSERIENDQNFSKKLARHYTYCVVNWDSIPQPRRDLLTKLVTREGLAWLVRELIQDPKKRSVMKSSLLGKRRE